MHLSFVYRIYPTLAQETRLLAWSDALRFLWNLANEQRLIAYGRTDRAYISSFDQTNDLTALRAELPWLADAPRNVCAQLVAELDKAWQSCFKKLAHSPRWKRKGSDELSLTEPHPKVWRLSGSSLHFPKLGPMRIVLHRPLEGKPKTCTLKRDGDQWFAHIVCEIDRPQPGPRHAPVVAIDRGITHIIADSEGRLSGNPRFLDKSLHKLARAQRVMSRRKKGSKNRLKAKLRVAKIHRKIRRQRAHFQHVESARYAKSHGVVVVEKLNVQGMVRSNLARHINDAGWSGLTQKLRYKLEQSGGFLVEIPAHYSSQECHSCKHVDSKSRRGELFCCTACGHADHADLNAAKVLLRRANRSVLPVDGIWPERPGGSRKDAVKLRIPRRGSRVKTAVKAE